MAIMDRKDRKVEDIKIGTLMLIADPESGPWWGAVLAIEEGHGVTTFTVPGKTITIGWHQSWTVAA